MSIDTTTGDIIYDGEVIEDQKSNVMNIHAPRDEPIDMTLRLWSEWVLLKPLLDKADVTAELLHIVGEPMATEKRLAARVADRHYASTASFRGKDDNDVSAWLTRIIGLIESGQDLVVYLLSGQIEAVLWITVLADGVTPHAEHRSRHRRRLPATRAQASARELQ